MQDRLDLSWKVCHFSHEDQVHRSDGRYVLSHLNVGQGKRVEQLLQVQLLVPSDVSCKPTYVVTSGFTFLDLIAAPLTNIAMT